MFVLDFGYFEPSSCGVYHCQAMKSHCVIYLLGLLTKGIRTNQIDAQCVPRDQFWILDWQFAVLLSVVSFKAATYVACLADTPLHQRLEPNKGEVLAKRQF